MKHFILFLLFFTAPITRAHHPILNVMQIHKWCESVAKLSKKDLLLWQKYLTLDKEMAEMCSKNLLCANCNEGKLLQQKIDNVVTKILQYSALHESFRAFVTLVKEELVLNQGHEYTGDHQVKINFKVLALVCEGCLDYVNELLAKES